MTKSLIFYFLLLLSLTFIVYIFIMAPIHPVFMTLLLIFYTMIICVIMSMWTFNYIYSIIMFLMMISGMLIIFLYFSSLISNEQNKIYLNLTMFFNYLLNTSTISFLIIYPLLYGPLSYMFSKFMNSTTNLENQSLTSLNSPLFSNTFMIYAYPYNNITFLCIFYLLLTLFIIIKICNIKSASLRKLK